MNFKTLTDDFNCPFCQAPGCTIAEETEGKKRRCVIHPKPMCAKYDELEPHEFAKAAGYSSLLCGCDVLSIQGLAPGWGCCACRNYNGDWRTSCKNCGHVPTPHPYGERIN